MDNSFSPDPLAKRPAYPPHRRAYYTAVRTAGAITVTALDGAEVALEVRRERGVYGAARAILTHVTGNDDTAERWELAFAEHFLRPAMGARYLPAVTTLRRESILRWLDAVEREPWIAHRTDMPVRAATAEGSIP